MMIEFGMIYLALGIATLCASVMTVGYDPESNKDRNLSVTVLFLWPAVWILAVFSGISWTLRGLLVYCAKLGANQDTLPDYVKRNRED